MKIANQRVLYITTDHSTIDDIMWGLIELGLEGAYSNNHPTLYPLNEEMVESLIDELKSYDFAITHNFSVNVAKACHSLAIPYIAWLFDSPQVATYTEYAHYPECHIFSFDKVQLNRLTKRGITNLYYQPLAANTHYAAKVSITEQDISKYSCDLSFIGQLYRNTSYDSLYKLFNNNERDVVDKAITSKVFDWSPKSNIYDTFSDEFIHEIEHFIRHERYDCFDMDQKHLIETIILSPSIAQIERKQLLLQGQEICDIRLYTVERDMDNASSLLGANNVYPAVYDEDLYKAYYSSKINLNVTLRSIESGVPQRIYDIMSVGGTVLSNYQAELSELFIPDKEVMLFESLDEYVDKVTYLLTHERNRIEIGINGYKRVSKEYNIKEALIKMIEKI